MRPKTSQHFDKTFFTRWLIPLILSLCILILAAVLVIALVIPAS